MKNRPLIRERWESPCGRVTLLRGDAFKITPTLEATMLCADPPYGIGYKHSGNYTPPGQNTSTLTGAAGTRGGTRSKTVLIRGDSKAFKPSLLHSPCSKIAFFGADHFCSDLPKGTWIAWDKRDGGGPDDSFSDVEFIHASFATRRNLVRHMWKGMCCSRKEEDIQGGYFKRRHVSQKPIRVMMHLIREAKLAPDSMVLDPFMGSGSTGIAALKLGHRFTGIEIDAKHFKTARKRFEAFLLTLPPDNQGTTH